MCPYCQDTRWRAHPNDSNLVIPCACVKKERPKRLLEQSGIPALFHDKDFKDLKLVSAVLQDAVRPIMKFAHNFPHTTQPGLILTGPKGLGKTHMAVAALRVLIGRDIEGRFWDYQSLLNAIRDGFSSDAGREENMFIRQQLADIAMLVLDDFGAHRSTDFVDDFVTDVINQRYNNCRGLILTTNLALTPDGIGRHFDERVYSRLMEMCTVVELKGKDYRVELARA